jgi:hypothetical protein
MTSPYPTRTDLEDQAAIEIGAAPPGSLRAAGKAQRPRQWQGGPWQRPQRSAAIELRRSKVTRTLGELRAY